MHLLLTQLCELLSILEEIRKRDPPLLPESYRQKYKTAITQWFASHNLSIYNAPVEPAVLLSALFPAKRTDRVYNIRIPRLTNTLKRCLGLGLGRLKQLDQWQQPGRGDLGECVERVLQQAEFAEQPVNKQVTVRQVDDALANIASRCRFSAPRLKRTSTVDDDAKVLDILTDIYHRLQSREAKWFTRMILKDYSSIDLDGHRNLIYSCLDPRLPVAMQMYDDFEAAVTELRSLPASQISRATARAGVMGQRADNPHLLCPRIGVKVGPPRWVKAKGGVKHAVSVISGRNMSIERKHDGEYCQIHLDLSKDENCIQIFSKSGKDSTMDREGVHKAIKEGLRIGQDDCAFSSKCILEGELLVWSDKINDILEFHKIRKHVARSGSFLGTKEDSQPHPHEHLMIMLYDVLLIDDSPALHLPYCRRRELLMQLVRPINGRIGVIAQIYVHFSQATATKRLKKSLAQAFVRRWEGLVLKPADEPYFHLEHGSTTYPSRWIKMKKDCIHGLGDTADFAVVGAGYDAKRACQLGMPDLLWTHFFLGCLRNKNAVLNMDAKPDFLIVDCVTDCIKKTDIRTINQHGKFVALDVKDRGVEEILEYDFASIDSAAPRLHTIFKRPFVFDIAGSGFDKGADRKIFTLRFPRVLKVRWDRNWKEATDLPELQVMADEARTPPTNDLEKEVSVWMAQLNQIDHGIREPVGSWDVTDDDEGHDDSPVGIATNVVTKTACCSVCHSPPPLVRMDTKEIDTREQRTRNGEVMKGPFLKHSMSSETTLPTPSTSPVTPTAVCRNYNHGREEFNAAKSLPSKRKLDIPAVAPNEGSRGWKRRKPGADQRSEATLIIAGVPERHQPLGEMINSARPSPTFRSRTLEAIRRPQAGDFGKIAVGRHEHNQDRHRQLTRENLPSSPDMQATAATNQTPSIVTTLTHTKSVHKYPTSVPSILTAPSTINLPLRPGVPDLKKGIVLLSSSFDAQMPPATDFLAKYDIRPRPFSEFLQGIKSPTGKSKVEDRGDLTLLIQSMNTKATTNDLVAILSYGGTLRPQSMSLWDQDLLTAIVRSQDQDLDEEDIIKRFFYAKICWAADEDGRSGKLKIYWRNGKIDSISEEQVRSLRRMLQSRSLSGSSPQ
ncbi:MAG: hypothetical protein Q9163_004143 [Psora crenata]